MMDSTRLLTLFQQLGVVMNGHFVLSSGRHSNEYWEKFRLLEWPRVTERLCQDIAERYQGRMLSAVIGPTTGGALLAQEVARQLDTRCLLAEPVAEGGRGLSLRETLCAIEPYHPDIAGIEVLIDRSGGTAATQFSVPCHALLSVTAQTYSPTDCPLCAAVVPLVKPGTRG